MGIDMTLAMPLTADMEKDIDDKLERDILQELQDEEDDELISMIIKQNQKKCFCFKKKIKKDMAERVEG